MNTDGRIAVVPVVLAGGSGTRLWPLSRTEYPKQLLQLNGEQTLLQDTLSRLEFLRHDSAVQLCPPLIVCNEEYRFLVVEQLKAIGESRASLVLEPAGKNTAPAVSLAAAYCRRHHSDDPLLLVLPSDHVILEPEAFCHAVMRAVGAAQAGAIVTFGVVPDRPETGYGYIECGSVLDLPLTAGVRELIRFVEKPDAQNAAEYLERENFLWNGGMFLMRASVWDLALRALAPQIHEACEDAVANYERDGRFIRPDPEAFARSPSDSIDYAVMENLEAVATGRSAPAFGAVVPLEAGWSDVGSWAALLELGDADQHNNVAMGDACLIDTRDSLVLSKSRLVAAVGISDSIIVETPDAVLVTSRTSSQEVREVVDWLKTTRRSEADSHTVTYRPWGHFSLLDRGPGYQVKRLSITPGAAVSLQLHHHRAEHWIVVEGTAKVTRGDEDFLLRENCSTYIPVAVKHRLENPGSDELVVIEVQSGSYLGEDDIVRFEDAYNRVKLR